MKIQKRNLKQKTSAIIISMAFLLANVFLVGLLSLQPEQPVYAAAPTGTSAR